MQYDSYELKVAKVAKIFKWIFKHLTAIIISAAFVLASAVTLLATRGIIVSAESCPVEIVYGDELDYSASAFLSGVDYEYCRVGTDDWTDTLPKDPGSYKVRAVSKATFGNRYGKVEYFTLRPKKTTVKIASSQLVYGEEPQAVAELVGDDRLTCTGFIYNTDRTVVKADLSAVKITDKDGKDVTGRYLLEAEEREVVTAKKPITVSISDKTKVYDGKPLVSHEFVLAEGTLAENDTISVGFSAEITGVGSVENSVSIAIHDEDGNDVTRFYNIKLISGKLSVTARPITVSTPSASAVYSDYPLSKVEYAIGGDLGLAGGHVLTATDWANITEVGICDNVATFAILDVSGEDVTSNYDIIYEWGTLEITKRPIAISTPSYSAVYDGELHSKTEYTASSGEYEGLVWPHQLSISSWAQIRYVGEVENSFEAVIVNQNGDDVTHNYDITYSFGTLTLTKRKITVTTATESWVYDGTSHENLELLCDNLGLHDSVIITGVTEITEVSTVSNKIEFYIESVYTGEDVTSNYEITYVEGTLSVTKREIHITSASTTFTYEGYDQCDLSVIVGGAGLAPSEIVEVVTYTTVNEVTDGVENLITVRITRGETDVSANYEITYTYGILKVEPRNVIVQTHSYSDTYSGEEISYPFFDTLGLADGHLFKIISSTAKTDAGIYDNEVLEYDITDAEGISVKENYTVYFYTGTIEIKKRPVYVSTASAEKVYDGTPLTAHEWTVAPAEAPFYSLVEGHEIVADAPYGSQTVRGWSYNYYSGEVYVYDAVGNDVTDNYEISVGKGILNVLPRNITVITEGGSTIYDGQVHTFESVVVSDAEYPLCDGHYLEVISAREFKNVYDSGTNELAVDVLDENGEIVTYNYEISYVYGDITVVPRLIELTGNGYAGVYDGEWHYDDTLVDSSTGINTGLVEGHYIDIYGSDMFRNYVVDAENTVYFHICDVDGAPVTSNYEIKTVFGRVNISKRTLEVQTESYYGEYDGKYHGGYIEIVGGDGLADGDEYTVLEGTAFKNVVDDVENTVQISIFDGKEDVTDCYDISYEYGWISIYAREVYIRTGSASWVYDGKEHKCDAFEVIWGSSFVSNHKVKVTDATTVRDVVDWTYNTKFVISVFDKDYENVTDNYAIVIVDYGILEITPLEITISSATKKKVYDGKPLTAESIIIPKDSPAELVKGHKITAEFYGTITEPGTVPNGYYHGTVRITDEDGRNVTSNYEIIEYREGELTVTESDSGDGGDGEDGPGGPGGSGGSGGSGGGSGGSGGSGGMGGLGEDGSIGLPEGLDMGDAQATVVYMITSDTTGDVYLKFKSFGSYNGTGWDQAEEYGSLLLDYASAYYISAFAIEHYGAPESYIKIQSMNGQYVLPYYSLDKDCYIQTSDVHVYGETGKEYCLYYYDISYAEGFALPEVLSAFEEEYAQFVREHYLDIDADTLEYMQTVIAENGFDISDPYVIEQVANFIRNSAVYDIEYNRELDKSDNIVVAFLSQYKSGVCQHYASAATMLYRALGIPARYTIGYVSETIGGKCVPVTAAQAHAWVEVYIDGFGWLNVEVTGSGSVPLEGAKLEITPEPQIKEYDGTPLYAKDEISFNAVLEGLVSLGYTYKITVSGSQTEVGASESYIESFILLDPNGYNVTDQFDIKYNFGRLEVTECIVKIYIYEKKYEYDGESHSHSAEEYVVVSMPSSLTLIINDIRISLTDVGYISSDMINSNILEYISYEIYDSETGEDVTDRVAIQVVNFADGKSYLPLEITKREIIITTSSASKPYDGETLTNPNFYVSQGFLAEGHSVKLDVIGVAISATSENTVDKESFTVLDSNGNNVTANYSVEYILGTLKIT